MTKLLVRLTVVAVEGWTSPITGGTVPAGCPRTYLLWLPAGDRPGGDQTADNTDAAPLGRRPLVTAG